MNAAAMLETEKKSSSPGLNHAGHASTASMPPSAGDCWAPSAKATRDGETAPSRACRRRNFAATRNWPVPQRPTKLSSKIWPPPATCRLRLETKARRAFRGYWRFRRLLAPKKKWPEPDLAPDENVLFSQLQKIQTKISADLGRFGKFIAAANFSSSFPSGCWSSYCSAW